MSNYIFHAGKRWTVPDSLAHKASDDDQWPRYQARLEDERWEAHRLEMLRLAAEESQREATQLEIDKVWDEAVKYNDCFDAHDGTHPWVLRIEQSSWQVLCKICYLEWVPPMVDDWKECAGSHDIPINPSWTSHYYRGMNGDDWEFEVTLQVPYGFHKRPPHKHSWHYEPDGSHRCFLCDLDHPPKCALRACWHPHFTDESIPLPRPRPEETEYLGRWTA